ncbi:hypothetical protein JSQ81_16660 [Sporosarcina sp. Marseille-Q4063]|uniref:hypothetical protein n=1 Tax=Sporosarcina sp. Marseille-Q4063 TaxID=2810514 RepID=UPI001BB0BA99|nr:hypothetical protein [Sporosarcina sp. Marseille-Q4063]QUW21414.1 hypothetical protein JSQ81_16660 [Sporosarcina sp. Marseille-Q4063]
MKQTMIGVVLFVILGIPSLISLVESIMILHMLVQIPLLVIAGWLMGQFLVERFQSFFEKWNDNGIPGILVFVIITMYWMLPRVMDEALTIWYIQLFKFIGLPIAGLALRDSWSKLQITGKSFIFLNYISMFGLMGWLYVDSPIQLCNNYLELEQKMLGWGFLVLTAGMVIYIVQLAFTDQSSSV